MYVEMKREMGQGLAGSLKYKTLGSDHADTPPMGNPGLDCEFCYRDFSFQAK